MRLDAFLVEQKKAGSRGRAKRAIINGHVSVDGKTVTKPSKQVDHTSEIEITEVIDKPAGYFKLKYIQENAGLIQKGDIVLDLGSSAGGFLLFASEMAAKVTGIEYSTDFMPVLEDLAASHDNIILHRGDAYNVPLDVLSDQPVDVILNDITAEPESSIKVLERVLPLLKSGGRLLQVLKLPDRSDLDFYLDCIQGLGLTVQSIIEPQKKEVYVMAVRN